MPESPEVRIITEQLCEKVKDQLLIGLEILGGRFIKNPPEGLNAFKKELPIKLESVACKGKFIYFSFKNEWYLFNTLGMTGSWRENKDEHSSFKFTFENLNVYFTDIRHFGTMKFVRGKDLLEKKLKSIGWDILNEGPPDFQYFHNKIASSNKNITEILMSQSIFSGIGNYIKSECLYRAKISPWRTGSSLSKSDSLELLKAICIIMIDSYNSGGASLATYKNFEGQGGEYAKKLQVYKRDFDPLGNFVKSETTPDKRTTWWVPEIQK